MHCRLRKQVLIFSVVVLSVAVDWYLLTYLFHAYIFHPCKYLSLRVQYLHFSSSGIAQFHTPISILEFSMYLHFPPIVSYRIVLYHIMLYHSNYWVIYYYSKKKEEALTVACDHLNLVIICSMRVFVMHAIHTLLIA